MATAESSCSDLKKILLLSIVLFVMSSSGTSFKRLIMGMFIEDINFRVSSVKAFSLFSNKKTA